ncbi:MAG: methyltransferase domain-containing protein [Deltaproteobacteria bacterium]|nr:methyltransferase domain-containing protein [Deltaproteobacteria bacterium]
MRGDSAPITCPGCGLGGVDVFYRVAGVPVNSTLQLSSRREARELATGTLALGFCHSCGFIHNTAFDPTLTEYSSRCEETQGFSPVFSRWQGELARRLVERHDLRGREIIEIGCGKGDFLNALCEIGGNRGIGFDPAYVPERNTSPARDRIKFIREFYTAENAPESGDFIVCKMTLEHIPRAADFVRMVRASLGDRRDVVVFFQVPDMRRILDEAAFWDLYYEHCSYFDKASLCGLFQRSGFEVQDLESDYGGQYLMLEATPGSAHVKAPATHADEVRRIAADVAGFRERAPRLMDSWRGRLAGWKVEGRAVAVWGSGSKGVAFLTSLGIGDEVRCVVDINPHRAGHFMAGSGHPIVTPRSLIRDPVDKVILMNPVYLDEVQSLLGEMGLNNIEVVSVTRRIR